MTNNEGVVGKGEVEMQGKRYDVDMLFIGVRLTDDNVCTHAATIATIFRICLASKLDTS